MNFQQLEYIVAVDTWRHFATAAEKCFVTQPTLSMMIHKLEEELEVTVFDRSRHPVIPTEEGEQVIFHARQVLQELARMKEAVRERRTEISGELSLGIIPTLAPYLLPLIIEPFRKDFPKVKLRVREMVTDQIILRLRQGELDAGLLVTPLEEQGILEIPLFYERFFVYISPSEHMFKKKYLLPSDIDPHKLWLLEEGHCFRSQIMNLCELKRQAEWDNFEYEAGSIETLKKIVDQNKGMTIIPELALNDLSAARKKQVRSFKKPEPVREVSLVTHRNFVKKRILEKLTETIVNHVPKELLNTKQREVIGI